MVKLLLLFAFSTTLYASGGANVTTCTVSRHDPVMSKEGKKTIETKICVEKSYTKVQLEKANEDAKKQLKKKVPIK